ncbi:MAG: Unknown protein [uncultured Thiotrichaceae bacterium]|uniref:Uncharacterized protein n=1 Tax=uncultured Thiotrichaceae bacterium TaxID=298394 RepID=A0A6S6UBD3_9GAMM|nr:MAG: Unknown protein [uncultured Thiotrichaceae bacterium]
MPRFFLLLITTLFFSISASAHTGMFAHAITPSETSHLLMHTTMLLPVVILIIWLSFIVKRWINS